MTSWQDNAERFAYRADQCIDAERNTAVRSAVQMLRKDHDINEVLETIERSVARQCRMAGIRYTRTLAGV